MNFDSTTISIIVAVLAVLILAFLLMRRRKPAQVEKKTAEPYVASTERPYMKNRQDGLEGNAVTDQAAAATTDVAGEVLGVHAHRELPGAGAPKAADELTRLKGVGPKFATRLSELGISRFEQLAALTESELALLDERLGPFRGRLARDRVAEQASYLSRGDVDGFEARFGKLGG